MFSCYLSHFSRCFIDLFKLFFQPLAALIFSTQEEYPSAYSSWVCTVNLRSDSTQLNTFFMTLAVRAVSVSLDLVSASSWAFRKVNSLHSGQKSTPALSASRASLMSSTNEKISSRVMPAFSSILNTSLAHSVTLTSAQEPLELSPVGPPPCCR